MAVTGLMACFVFLKKNYLFIYLFASDQEVADKIASSIKF